MTGPRSAVTHMLPERGGIEQEFRRYSTNMKGGISTIIETPGAIVHGALYAIRRAEPDAMEALKNVNEGLNRRETFRVPGEDQTRHQADLYRVARPGGPFRLPKSAKGS